MSDTMHAIQPIQRKWIGQKADQEAASLLVKHFDLHPLVAQILTTRSCSTIESSERFLNPNRAHLLNPSLMHDMDRAANRIRQAIERQERILVVGDYDVDGVCSTTILVRTLKALRAQPDWYIPSRFTDGYGLSAKIVDRAHAQDIKLLVTVDNGISAFEAAALAKATGIDLVITDHHHISDIPIAYAIVHPAFPQAMYTFHDLCGAGVAFKLSQVLLGRFPEELLDLVALATVADQMPLIGENRVLVKEGLDAINRERCCVGLAALINVSGLTGKRITSTSMTFQLAPRENAVGRLAEASRAVELFLTDDPMEAINIATELNIYNNRRKALTEETLAQALMQINDHPEWLEKRGLVLAGENWHEGLIGIISGKLTERFHKSTLCISIDGEVAKGSGRAIPNFDLYRTLADVQQSSETFTKYGGHSAAAGFSLNTRDIDKLRDAFVDAIDRNWFEDVELEPHTLCDAPLELSELSYALVDQLKRLEPFGQANPEPVFFVRAGKIGTVQTLGADAKHLKIWVKNAIGQTYPVLAFGRGAELSDWEDAKQRHLLVTVGDNVWNGNRSLHMQLVDAR